MRMFEQKIEHQFDLEVDTNVRSDVLYHQGQK